MRTKKTKTSATLGSFNLVLGIFLLSILPQIAQAGKFANQFTEFELPSGWTCGLEKVTWLCQHMEDKKKREALIILAAKIRGNQDSMEQYQSRLTGSKNYVAADGKGVNSEVKFTKSVEINGHPWIDSLHFQSEVPGFITRYFATIEQNIGILITFSVEKDKYAQYVSDLTQLMNSLKAFKKSVGPTAAVAFQNTQIPTKMDAETIFGGAPTPAKETPVQKYPPPPESDSTLYILIGVAVVIGLWFLKKRRG
jgi:hypothetical protein